MTALAKSEDCNPRYLVYCTVHGFEGDPDGMLEHDKEEWPGACMMPFMLWIQEQWRKFREANGLAPLEYCSDENHKEFDKWIGGSAPVGRKEVR